MSLETINPYRRLISAPLEALPDFINRIKWDLHQESRKSRNRLASLRNTHRGKTAVILCNGPSLNEVPLELLTGVYTIGLNKINLLFDRSTFRPSCIVSINEHVIDQNADFYNATDIPLFLAHRALKNIPPRPNISFLHTSGQRKFAKNVCFSVSEGATVTYIALQLAYHMGFSRVALVGCDHNFAAKGRANSAVTAGQHDADHFDPRYFSGGVTWQLPDLDESEISYILARSAFFNDGRTLVNCTTGGKLEVLPREPLASFLSAEV